jgi:hypothetical protein
MHTGGELFEVHPVVLKLGTSCESFRGKTSSKRRDVGWSSPETELAWDKTKEGRLASQQRNKQRVFAQSRSRVRTFPVTRYALPHLPFHLVANIVQLRGATSSFTSWQPLSSSRSPPSLLKPWISLYFFHLFLSWVRLIQPSLYCPPISEISSSTNFFLPKFYT